MCFCSNFLRKFLVISFPSSFFPNVYDQTMSLFFENYLTASQRLSFHSNILEVFTGISPVNFKLLEELNSKWGGVSIFLLLFLSGLVVFWPQNVLCMI